MNLKESETKAIEALKEQLECRYLLSDFRLFGSKARGEDTFASDIDVMIELPSMTPVVQSDIYDLVYDINLEHDCLISLVIFTTSELEEGPMSESPIYKTIMKEGIAF